MRLPQTRYSPSLDLLPKAKQAESGFFVFALCKHVDLKLLEASLPPGYLIGDQERYQRLVGGLPALADLFNCDLELSLPYESG